jgi:hypothetical protein
MEDRSEEASELCVAPLIDFGWHLEMESRAKEFLFADPRLHLFYLLCQEQLTNT